MERKSNKGLIVLVIILLIGVIGLGGYIVYDKVINKDNEPKTEKKETKVENDNNSEQTNKSNNEDAIINLEDLYGTYTWGKSYKNTSGYQLDLKVQLVLNEDGTATYSASSGYESEKTKGSYVYENGKIIYTREYFNYQGTNGTNEDTKYNDENSKKEIFNVLDKNTLQNNYYGELTELKKQ